LRVKNVADLAKNLTITVTFTPVASASAPSGEAAVAGLVPMLLDGGIDQATLQRNYTSFSGPITRTIPPGGEIDVDFYLNRGAMGTAAGLKFQSIVQVSDSLSLTRVDVPVSATSTSLAGLWVGEASVGAVDQILGNAPVGDATPTPTPSQDAPVSTSAPFTMRIIVHIDASGHATLLQQAYIAQDGTLLGVTNPVFKTYTPAKYKDVMATAKAPARVSSAAFPLDLVADGSAAAAPGATVQFSIPLLYDAPTNPFVHAYHPAHDNRTATFDAQPLPAGVESYTVQRTVNLAFAANSANDPSWGSTLLDGTYSETISGLRVNDIHTSGTFFLKRVANAPILVK
jgi:hypothetical protein